MCARYSLNVSGKQLAEALKLREALEWQARFNLAPTQPLPVVTADAPDVAQLMRFGLLPPWARETKVAQQFINARSEKLLTHATYAKLVKTQRCVVPMTGFYEWTKDKRPHFVTKPGAAIALAAGLWNVWRSPEGVDAATFTILTCASSKALAWLHDRMPVWLDDEGRARWLASDVEPKSLLELLQPTERVDVREVNRRVNDVRNEGAQLLEPPAQSQLSLL